MPLQAPVLDDRTFRQLVEEAKARIPRYTPEWTNLNPSDPGMTLVQLHAWLTETILYRLNQLPDLNYIKFLDLLQIKPTPAKAARAELTFTLKKLAEPEDPLVVLVPKDTQVGVDDPDLEEDILFETDRTLTALNAALAAVIVPGGGDTARDVVTEYDADAVETRFPVPFYPFGDSPAVDAVCLFGILLRPHYQDDDRNTETTLDRFPEGELDLAVLVPQVLESDAEGATITGPMGQQALFPWEVATLGEQIVWEAYAGTEHATHFPRLHDSAVWRELQVVDRTAALERSGHVYLDVPAGLATVRFDQLSRAFWDEIGLLKPPTTGAELAADIRASHLDPAELDDETWTALLGATDPDLATLLSELDDPETVASLVQSKTLHVADVDAKVWIDVGYPVPPAPYALTWFRARLRAAPTPQVPEAPPQVSRFLLNTVAATAAVTRIEEVLAASDGRPGQSYTLRHAPVYVSEETGAPDLTLVVERGDEVEEWQLVEDFYRRTPDDAVYTLDPETGTITFGDGQHGRIPVAGAQIVARRYRYGGGEAGNVGPGTITDLKSALSDVDAVTNVRAAAGGADAEPLEEAKLRAPHDLRTRERAVTAEDFAYLALRTPGVSIQRAYALAETAADVGASPPAIVPNSPGAITVVILPESDAETPQPTEDELDLVCAHLNDRRLITTELYVVGPRYLELSSLEAQVTVSRQSDLRAVTEGIRARLLNYLHPLKGGDDGRGWPFGQDVYYGHIYRQILAVSGVQRVLCLDVAASGATGACDDVVPVPEGWLVHLPREALKLKVQYDPYG